MDSLLWGSVSVGCVSLSLGTGGSSHDSRPHRVGVEKGTDDQSSMVPVLQGAWLRVAR